MNSGKFGSLRETQNSESDDETGSKLSGEVGASGGQVGRLCGLALCPVGRSRTVIFKRGLGCLRRPAVRPYVRTYDLRVYEQIDAQATAAWPADYDVCLCEDETTIAF